MLHRHGCAVVVVLCACAGTAAGAPVVWQIGVPDNSDNEFGDTPMQRAPIDYSVPLDWADYLDSPGDFWLDFPGQINPPEDWPIMPQTVHIHFDTLETLVEPELRVWASYRSVDQRPFFVALCAPRDADCQS